MKIAPKIMMSPRMNMKNRKMTPKLKTISKVRGPKQ